jgi:anti-sigma factor RsiW
MMNHDLMEMRLDDLVDGLLDEPERRAVQRHLDECATCRAEVEALQALRSAAQQLPRQMQPPRDLWAGIASRIEQQRQEEAEPAGEAPDRVQVLHVDFGRRARPGWGTQRGMLAAAAIALVVLSSSVTAMLMRSGPGTDPGSVAIEPAAGAGPAQSALVAFAPAEREFVATAEQLRFALEAQRERLSPATVAVVEENLRIIDGAIREARAALEADPANRDLTFLLMDVYKKKIDLLQNAVQISSL